jgi:hypothetical protein
VDDQTSTAALLRAQFGYSESLFNAVVRRLRNANTIFGDNIKLVLRQLDQEHWALLKPPYLLVVPTVVRIPTLKADEIETEDITNPRSITFLAQLDGRGSENEWMAADDIELVEKQLINALVNWRPNEHYKPTGYAGMRIEGTQIPQVKVAFVFVFFEQIRFDCEPEIGDQAPQCSELGDIKIRLHNDCGPPPCDPCAPCAPGDPTIFVLDPPNSATEPEPPGAYWPNLGGAPRPNSRR